jgi:ABC-2 type transport system ATP-binding protein
MDVQVRRLSLGERMKMEIMASLIHSPQILFLDEPTIGLDIISQRNIRDFLKYYNEQTKTTVILTSHYTKDIETLCRRTIIINEGTVVYDGELAEINDILGNKKLLGIKSQSVIDKSKLTGYGNIREYDGYCAVLEVEKDKINEYSKELLEKLPLEDFTVTDIPLEEGIEYFYHKKAECAV